MDKASHFNFLRWGNFQNFNSRFFAVIMVSTRMMQFKKWMTPFNFEHFFLCIQWTFYFLKSIIGNLVKDKLLQYGSNHGNITDIIIITLCSMERALKVDKNIGLIAAVVVRPPINFCHHMLSMFLYWVFYITTNIYTERVAVYNGIFCAVCGGIFCVVYGGIFSPVLGGILYVVYMEKETEILGDKKIQVGTKGNKKI